MRARLCPPRVGPPPAPHFPASRGEGGWGLAHKSTARLFRRGLLKSIIWGSYGRIVLLSAFLKSTIGKLYFRMEGGEGLKSRTGGRWPGPSDASGAGVAARPFQRAPGRCAQKYTQKYTQRAHETIGPFLLSLMSTGKKNAKSKTQTGTKARERAFFGAATPVRARGHGFREWGGNSNLKRNLSPSESDGLRFPLKIQFWVLWR